MLQTLRAPFIASTAAALSLAAVAVPTGQSMVGAASPWSADVTLAALLNPFTELLATGEVAQDYLFGAYYNGGDVPTPGAGEANWPAAGFDQTGGDLLNYLLYQQLQFGYYNTVGTLPNNAINASPVLQQLQVNLFTYVNVALTGLNSAVSALAAGVWDYPAALLTAGQLALQGQIVEALGVLTDAVVGPITEAGASLLEAGAFVLNDVVAKVGALVAAIPQIVTTFAGASIGSAAVLAGKSAAIFTDWVARLAQFDLEGAWNVGVAGLLGPTGLPGTVLNLTTGAGVQTGPIVNPETDIAGNFVPSFRTAIQAAVWTVAEALSATAPPTAAVTAAPEAPSAASVRASQATAVDPVTPQATDTAAGPGDSPDAPPPATPASAGRSVDPVGKAAATRASGDSERAGRGAAGRNGE